MLGDSLSSWQTVLYWSHYIQQGDKDSCWASVWFGTADSFERDHTDIWIIDRFRQDVSQLWREIWKQTLLVGICYTLKDTWSWYDRAPLVASCFVVIRVASPWLQRFIECVNHLKADCKVKHFLCHSFWLCTPPQWTWNETLVMGFECRLSAWFDLYLHPNRVNGLGITTHFIRGLPFLRDQR